MNIVQSVKSTIRRRVMILREQLTERQRQQWSKRICQRIAALPEVRDARVILLYQSILNEPDIGPLYDKLWRAGKRLALPRVIGEHDMEARLVKDIAKDLAPGYKNILEPKTSCEVVDPAEIDVVLVPGSSFDTRGNRLGMGFGFYDRYLARAGMRAAKIGVAYTFQVLEEVPSEPHDVRMDKLVTEAHTLDCAGEVQDK
jgi:5-formyltetrahydrofolate cyclo-ligase